MAFKFGYSTLRWKTPNLEPLLVQLKEAGWDGWEMRQSLDWVGTPGTCQKDLRKRRSPCCCGDRAGIANRQGLDTDGTQQTPN